MLLCHSKHFEGAYMKNLLPELMLPVLLVVLGICLCMATGCTSDSSDTTAPPTTDAAVSGAAKGSANAGFVWDLDDVPA